MTYVTLMTMTAITMAALEQFSHIQLNRIKAQTRNKDIQGKNKNQSGKREKKTVAQKSNLQHTLHAQQMAEPIPGYPLSRNGQPNPTPRTPAVRRRDSRAADVLRHPM